MAEERKTSHRGFASMDPEQRRAIASKGGVAAHAKGTAHEFTTEEARKAGRKGGEAVSQDREHMSKIGRRGGEARGGAMAKARHPPTPGAPVGGAGESVAPPSMEEEGVEGEEKP